MTNFFLFQIFLESCFSDTEQIVCDHGDGVCDRVCDGVCGKMK